MESLSISANSKEELDDWLFKQEDVKYYNLLETQLIKTEGDSLSEEANQTVRVVFEQCPNKIENEHENNEEDDHTCIDCNKIFSSSESLASHVKQHSKQKRFYCGYCSKVFQNLHGLEEHLKTRIAELPNANCNENNSDKSAPRSTTLQSQNGSIGIDNQNVEKVRKWNKEEISNKTKKNSLQCKLCNRSLKTRHSLKQHEKKNHGEHCNFCSLRFVSYKKLEYHIRSHTEEKPFKCNMCEKEYKGLTQLKLHKKVHFKKRYKCDSCPRSFCSTETLIFHCSRVHIDERSHECEICGKKYRQRGILLTHMKFHTGNLHRCDICNKGFTSKFRLIRHKNSHTEEKPHQCDICGVAFKRIEGLTNHKKNHSGEKPFQCEVCGKTFVSTTLLKLHYVVHTGDKPYKCDICDRRFTQSSSKRTHMKTHTGFQHVCDICGKGFPRPGQMNSHKQIHSGEKTHKCSICQKTFFLLSTLKVHSKTHTQKEKTFKCTICGKLLATKTGLTYHFTTTHTEERPFQCEICGKSFKAATQLRQHKVIHSKKKHKCQLCGLSFGRFSVLEQHIAIHTGEKPYKCDICNKSFARTSLLNQHKKHYKCRKITLD